MNFYVIYSRIFLLLSAVLLISCGIFQEAGSGSEAGNSSRIAYIDDSLFIKVPSSATGDTSNILSKSTQKIPADHILEHYTIVRGFIAFANEIVHNNDFGVKKLVRGYRDSLPWGLIEKQSVMRGKFEGVYWVATYNNSYEYPFDVKIYTDSVSSLNLAFSLAFNGSETEPKGKAYYRMDLLEPQKVKSDLRIWVEFSATSKIRRLDFLLTSKAMLGDSLEGFKNLALQLYEQNDILHISGASYHPYIANLIPDTSEYCYEFYGYSDTLNNLSILYVGLPPASINNNNPELFTEYDLASILIKRIIRKDIHTINDTIKQCIVTSYKDSLTLQEIFDSVKVTGVSWLRPSSELSAITRADLEYFIELNRSSNIESIQSLLLLKYLKQPVYFNKNGYVSNGNTVPSQFTTLSSVSRVLPLQYPKKIKDLVITPW